MNFQLNITCKLFFFVFVETYNFIADLVISHFSSFSLSLSPLVCLFTTRTRHTLLFFIWLPFDILLSAVLSISLYDIHCLIYLLFVLMFVNKLNVFFFYFFLLSLCSTSGAIKLSRWYWHAFYTSIIHLQFPVMMISKFIDFIDIMSTKLLVRKL